MRPIPPAQGCGLYMCCNVSKAGNEESNKVKKTEYGQQNVCQKSVFFFAYTGPVCVAFIHRHTVKKRFFFYCGVLCVTYATSCLYVVLLDISAFCWRYTLGNCLRIAVGRLKCVKCAQSLSINIQFIKILHIFCTVLKSSNYTINM